MSKILVIDDEAEFNEMLCIRLEKTGGYETLKAFDGEEGLKSAQENKPDLIILDVMMPRMNGFEVFKHLKDNPATNHIPVVILTASANPDTAKSLIENGVTEYVTKPFEAKELLGKIAKLLKK